MVRLTPSRAATVLLRPSAQASTIRAPQRQPLRSSIWRSPMSSPAPAAHRLACPHRTISRTTYVRRRYRRPAASAPAPGGVSLGGRHTDRPSRPIQSRLQYGRGHRSLALRSSFLPARLWQLRHWRLCCRDGPCAEGGREPGPAVRSGIQARDVWFVMAGPGGCHRDW